MDGGIHANGFAHRGKKIRRIHSSYRNRRQTADGRLTDKVQRLCIPEDRAICMSLEYFKTIHDLISFLVLDAITKHTKGFGAIR
jgi:hypothetical protein